MREEIGADAVRQVRDGHASGGRRRDRWQRVRT